MLSGDKEECVLAGMDHPHGILFSFQALLQSTCEFLLIFHNEDLHMVCAYPFKVRLRVPRRATNSQATDYMASNYPKKTHRSSAQSTPDFSSTGLRLPASPRSGSDFYSSRRTSTSRSTACKLRRLHH